MRKLRGAVSPEARVIIETKPGEECQVDYGTGPMVRDPNTGKYRRTRLFVLTLGCSRKSVRLLVFQSSTRVWAELHEKAFRRPGGSPRIVVLDNLGEGLRPDTYKAKCQMCHSADGLGTTPAGKAMKAPPFSDPQILSKSDADLIAATKNGKGKMPAYAGKLSDGDIKAVIAYIHTLQKK